MIPFALTLIALPVLFFGYSYVGYPAAMRLLARRAQGQRPGDPDEWPSISITVPAYNEERSIRATLERLLSLDYPADRRQILVISDASTDRTDDIVREFADRGVELLRLPARRGKTAAENAAGHVVTGEIVINTDATITIPAGALKALVRAFADPSVGVASGRDVSVGDAKREASGGEQGYVGYEMWVRSLETQLGSIVGASGCFYGIRRRIYDSQFPEELSRDFASALMAREHGLRAVSVEDAICIVPRTTSLQAEFRRKIRTMARGLQTLWFKRHLMNPFREGRFAIMLISHKLCRWLVYLAAPGALLGVILLATVSPVGKALLALSVLGLAAGIVALRWPAGRRLPRMLALPGFAVASVLAGILAWAKVFRRERSPVWEPTRRPA